MEKTNELSENSEKVIKLCQEIIEFLKNKNIPISMCYAAACMASRLLHECLGLDAEDWNVMMSSFWNVVDRGELKKHKDK